MLAPTKKASVSMQASKHKQQTPPTNRFPLSFSVQSSNAGGSSSTVSRRAARPLREEDERTFDELGRRNERRALALVREGLEWVEKMSEGEIDRETLKMSAKHLNPSLYRDLLLERHINSSCSYPPGMLTFKTWQVDKKKKATVDAPQDSSSKEMSAPISIPTPNKAAPPKAQGMDKAIDSLVSSLSIIEITPSATAVAAPPTLENQDDLSSLPSPSRFKRQTSAPPVLLSPPLSPSRKADNDVYRKLGAPVDDDDDGDSPEIQEAWRMMMEARDLA
ncbi:hypothetical protein BT69DRAFT_1279151 [Atractiella rhizophila]|nr:hypothetical protein BT69DRAFT_1279151 [Atractiella rhizophila]